MLRLRSVTYRVDPADPAVDGFYGAGRVTIDHRSRKIEIVTTVDVEFDVKDLRSPSVEALRKRRDQGKKSWSRKIPRDFQ